MVAETSNGITSERGNAEESRNTVSQLLQICGTKCVGAVKEGNTCVIIFGGSISMSHIYISKSIN